MTESRPRRQLLSDVEVQLTAAGVPSPRVDAELLLADVLGVSRTALMGVSQISGPDLTAYAELVARRSKREPLQHITGRAAFRHLELAVGPGVFVPRPETELLAGWAIEQARAVGRTRTPVVIDVGTGSGAIALSVATEVPGAQVHALELDERALAWAERNLAGHGVDLRHGDLSDCLTIWPELVGAVDVVVCNPPYVPLEAWESVAAEARDYDPHVALFSGHDGLDAVRVLADVASALVHPGGVLGVEHADAQATQVPALLRAGRWRDVTDQVDLAGRARYTTARLAR